MLPSASAATGVTLTAVVGGLTHPILVTNAGDGSGRLFVIEQGGKIRVIKAGVLLPTPFLDISDIVSHGGEQGLLGLAFHRDYENNGKFYVDFTRADGDTAINEYRVSANPDVASRATGRRIMTIDQPYANHNGGGIAFGPNGYLFIGMGDGGGTGDPQNRARNVNSLLGKMLRIDINGTSPGLQYRIPPSNPYVGRTGRDEIYRSGCAIRGAGRSTARPVTCGSATSGRTATRRSTGRRRRPGADAGSTTAGMSWKAATATSR